MENFIATATTKECTMLHMPEALRLAREVADSVEVLTNFRFRPSFLVTGSVIINGTGNDVDIVIGGMYLSMPQYATDLLLSNLDPKWSRAGHYMGDFLSFRHEVYNLIVYSKPIRPWYTARNICAGLAAIKGSVDKETRVFVHRMLLEHGDTAVNIGAVVAETCKDFRNMR